jgi:hypothetical protein
MRLAMEADHSARLVHSGQNMEETGRTSLALVNSMFIGSLLSKRPFYID